MASSTSPIDRPDRAGDPTRGVGAGSPSHSHWTGRKLSYGGVQSSQLDKFLGSAPFHGEKADEYYSGALTQYKQHHAKKMLHHEGVAPFYGENANEYYKANAEELGLSHPF